MKAEYKDTKVQEILTKYSINLKEFIPGKYCIYIHINKINGKYYIGQTNNPQERWSRQGGRYKDSPLFWKAIQKYGWDNFAHFIIENNLTQEEANKQEQYWIAKLGSYGDNGYNLTLGGDNYWAIQWEDEEFRNKMSQSFSKARKEKWSNQKFAQEAQAKMQLGVQAFWADPEKRSKRIADITGDKNPNSKKVRNLETGLIFNTIKEATEWAGLNAVSCIGANCRGQRHSAGKHSITKEPLHWEYVIENEGVVKE